MTKRAPVRIKPQPLAFVRLIEVRYDFSEDVIDHESEPEAVIERKAEAISELLGCSYEQAERLVIGFSE